MDTLIRTRSKLDFDDIDSVLNLTGILVYLEYSPLEAMAFFHRSSMDVIYVSETRLKILLGFQMEHNRNYNIFSLPLSLMKLRHMTHATSLNVFSVLEGSLIDII